MKRGSRFLQSLATLFQGNRKQSFQPAHLYYINLDRRPDRREFMEGHLKSLGIPFSRWPGLWLSRDGLSTHDALIRERGVEDYVWMGTNPMGTIGCYLSHLEVLEHIAASGSQQTLVLEDDILVQEGFLEAVRERIGQVPPYDMILFDCYGSRLAADRINDFIYRPSRCHPHYHGAHTYLVGQGRAERILRVLEKKQIKDIDGLFLTAAGIRCYVVYTGRLKDGSLGSDRCHRLWRPEDGS